MSALGYENICGLDVTMNDAGTMSRIEGIGDVDTQREQGLQIERATADAMLEGHTVQEFHGNECLAILFPDVVNGADIGMV